MNTKNQFVLYFFLSLLLFPLAAELKLENKATSVGQYEFKLRVPKDWQKDEIGHTSKKYDIEVIFRHNKSFKDNLTFLRFEYTAPVFEARNFDEYLDTKHTTMNSYAEILERDEFEWKQGQNQRAQVYKYYYPKSEEKRCYLACVYRLEEKGYEYVAIYSSSSEKELTKNKGAYKQSFSSFRVFKEAIVSQEKEKTTEKKRVLPKGWNVMEGTHYRIEYQLKRKETFLKKINYQLDFARKECLKEMARYQKESSEKKNKQTARKMLVKIFSEKDAFTSYLANYMEDPSGYTSHHYLADVPENDALIFLYESSKSEKDFFKQLYSEVSSQVISDTFDRFFAHSWFMGGYREYFSEMKEKKGKARFPKLKQRADVRLTIQKNKDTLHSFTDLVSFSLGEFGQRKDLSFKQSCVLIYFLKSFSSGEKILERYLKIFRETKDQNTTTQEIFGNEGARNTSDLDKKFKKFIDKNF